MPDDVEVKVDLEETGKEPIIAPDVEALVKDWEEGGKQGPKPGSERWNDIYREAQEGKRTKQELDDLKAARIKDREAIEEMRKWNKAIVDSIDSVKGAISDTTSDKDLEDLETKLTSLKAEKKAAREKADFDRETAIDDQIVDAKLAIREHKVAKTLAKDKAKELKVDELPPDEENKLTPEESKAYKTWTKATTWFQHDPRMRKDALETEPEVWQDPDFEYATVEEVLDEVKKRVEKKFDYKPSNGDNRRRSPDLVEGADHGSKRITSVKLSSTEMELMKGLGVSPEDFAKQKAIIAKTNSVKGGTK